MKGTFVAILLDDNRSVWLHECHPYTPRAALSKGRTADVAIVGGGFTGVATAYNLARRFPELGIVLLEGKSLGNGASGRNAGMVLNYLSGLGLPRESELARSLYETFTSVVDGMQAIIAEHNLDVPLPRQGSYELFTSPAGAETAARKAEAWNKGGLPLRFLDRSELPRSLAIRGVCGAVFDPKAAQLNGVRYLQAMRGVLEDAGVQVFEDTVVQRIREGKRIEVETSAATLTAAAVVLATNAYTPQLGYFRDRVMALHSYVIASDALPQEQLASIGWPSRISFSDDLGRLTYGSVSDAGRIVLGGGSNSAYGYVFGNSPVRGEVPQRNRRAVEQRFHQCFDGAERVAMPHCWSGPLGVTGSRLPLMGVRGEHRNVYYSLGYSGAGITAAHLAGRILTDLYGGEEERWRHLPGLHRQGEWLGPEPFRWLGYQLYTTLTGRSRRRSYYG